MKQLEITLVAQLIDNYAYILSCYETGATAIVDCANGKDMIAHLQRLDIRPTAILNTHHHWDHTGGNEQLLARWPDMQVYGYQGDSDRISAMNNPLDDGASILIGRCEAQVILVPGHTSGHVAYYFPTAQAIFCGDTLFSVGCGRLFEGSPEQMHNSLQRLSSLPPETKVYCGHEYTTDNIEFALSVDPNNEQLLKFQNQVKALRAKNLPSIPTTIELEKQINPFLRTHDQTIKQAATVAKNIDTADPIAVFAAIRLLKDEF
jgi:hydroxyacylglutathione hydrolase